LKKAVIIGAGGHARVVLDAARTQGLDVIAAIDARADLKGTSFEGIEVLGDETVLPLARERGASIALLGVGSIDAGMKRRGLYDRVARLGFDLPPVVHRSAVVAPTATLGPASVVFAAAVVNPGARIGTNVIINTAAIVEHDVEIGDHSHISSGAHVAGGVRIGAGCHVGIGATIIQGVRLGDEVLVGAGAVVLADVSGGDRVAGVPARSIRGG
jgi:UDP-perosamine 4-acetyltransferase